MMSRNCVVDSRHKTNLTLICSNAPASIDTGVQYSFAIGTDDWSFSGSSPCAWGGDVSTCYNVESVSVSVDSGASVSSSHTWSGSGSRALTVSATVSNRLGPVTVTYVVVVRRYEEQTLVDGNDNPYQERVDLGTTSMSAAATLLLLPTGVTVHTQPASSYTAASTTNVVVTLQLAPAITVTSGHPFTAEMTSVSESGAWCSVAAAPTSDAPLQECPSRTFKVEQVRSPPASWRPISQTL